MIALAAIALNFAFKQILLDSAKLRAQATSDEITQTMDVSSTLGFFEPAPVITTLTDRAYLEHWASPTTYVQIDNLVGYPLAKSTNLGRIIIPPQTKFDDTDRTFEIEDAGDGAQMLVLDRLLRSDGVPVAIAHVGERLDDERELVRRARTILIISTIVGALIVIGASYAIASSAIDPIERLTEAMSEIGSDRLDRRISTARSDEVGKLAGAFNAMLARLQEAFARERQFISDASHELKTPLTVINANAQMLKRWGNADSTVRDESLDAIIMESGQLAGMVTGMLTLAKADSGDQIPKEPLDLGALVGDVVDHARERAAAKGLVLEAHRPVATVAVIGDVSLLRQLINNLVDNAIKFTEAGRIDVTLTRDAHDAVIDVADTGIGISQDVADRLFDRFFRSDASHTRIIEGTGLGLAIVRSIARVHRGSVSAHPRVDRTGSLFRVVVPALDTTTFENQ